MKNIYLVGFMGTGKTSVGKEVSRRLKRQFVDLDALIEHKQNRHIAEIFARDGEVAFRKIEKDVLKETSGQNNLIVACGGGIVIDPDNIRVMKESGIMLCLSASVEAILERTRRNADRPLLNVPDPAGKIRQLLKDRAVCYSQADKTFDTTSLSVKQVADEIIRLI